MKHRLLTGQIIIKMAAVLIVIALLNFSLAHLFLSERLTSHMNEDIENKKELITEIVETKLKNGESDTQFIEQLLQNNDDIKEIAIFDKNSEQRIAGNSSLINEQDLHAAIFDFEERYHDEKVSGEKMRTFYVPIENDKLLMIVTSLEEQVSLEQRIIFVDIFGTLVGFMLVLFLLWTIARKELRPLGEIEQFLSSFSEGNFSNRLTFDKNNHFSWLADKINEMAIKIDQLVKVMKEKADDKIEHMAFHDDLTNLPNRRKFREVLVKEIEEAKKEKRQFAVLYLDLDGFKTINDMLGHSYGDKLLIKITNRLKNVLGNDGIVARLGGDEFTAMVPLPEKKLEHIENICERLIEAFDEYFEIDGDKITISISIGVAFYPKDGRTHDILLRNADAALYEAKTLGKRQYVYYLPHMSEEVLERIELEKHLRLALDKNELTLHYQPQINAKTGEIVGVEVLLRWYHEEFGMVPPGKFIPIIEKSNLINEVGEWVLRTACAQSKKWQDEGMDKIAISVNVSARQFQQANLVEQVESILNETGLEPQYLTIEITESTAMENIRDSFEKMNALKRLGIQIAIDDFGTGHSSLRYLKSFPLDMLKIDRSFINDIDPTRNDTEVVTAIIGLAHNLKIGLIAEGVEEKRQLEFLMLNRCEIIQGYLFSKPLPEDEFKRWYRERKMIGIGKEGQ